MGEGVSDIWELAATIWLATPDRSRKTIAPRCGAYSSACTLTSSDQA